MRGIGTGTGLWRAATVTAGVVLLFASMPALARDLKWGPHIDLEAKPGSKRSLGEADLFVPLLQNADTLLFGSFRARMDDHDGNEGNYGLGLRHMLNAGWNLGAYGYFDRRRTEYGHHFHQATIGLEALSQDWDLRANYYAPIGRRSHQIDSLNAASISGATVVVRGGEERSLGGFDAEVGWRVPLFDAKAEQQLRVYGGGYRFSESGVPDISGPRARAELTFDSVPGLWEGSRFSLGAEWQHDEPRGSQGFLTARLRIPLQVYGKPAARLTPMERRMADPVVRDVDVVSRAGSFGAPEVATANGGVVTVLSSGSTVGADLPNAVAAAGNNSTVILTGAFDLTTGIILQSGQTVMGAGTLQVRSPSGRTAVLAAPGATVTSSVSGTSAFSMAQDATLSGIVTSSVDAQAVDASGTTNATIINNRLTSVASGGAPSMGITANAAANITIRNNVISVSSTGGVSSATALDLFAVTNALVAGNTITATAAGGANAYAVSLDSSNLAAGSVGNRLGTGNAGGCNTQNNGSGFVGYANAPDCNAF